MFTKYKTLNQTSLQSNPLIEKVTDRFAILQDDLYPTSDLSLNTFYAALRAGADVVFGYVKLPFSDKLIEHTWFDFSGQRPCDPNFSYMWNLIYTGQPPTISTTTTETDIAKTNKFPSMTDDVILKVMFLENGFGESGDLLRSVFTEEATCFGEYYKLLTLEPRDYFELLDERNDGLPESMRQARLTHYDLRLVPEFEVFFE